MPSVDLALHVNEKSSLKLSSATGVTTAMSRNRTHLRRGRWIGAGNRYLLKALKHIADDLDPQKSGVFNDKHMSEYIAASAPVHCVDGCAILGGAVHALLVGDPATARHLAYYAELRGSMSLLAAGGIGVFNHRHFVIDRTGSAKAISGKSHGTHDAAWLYLDYWSSQPDALDALGSMIRPGGVALIDWVNAVPGASWNTAGRSLFTDFGLDIKRLVNDREARNTASYRPTSLVLPDVAPTAEVVAFVEGLWSLMEPSSSAGFEMLDLRLVAVVLSRLYRLSNGGQDPIGDPTKYRDFVQATADLAIIDPSQRPLSVERVISQMNPDPHDILAHALSRNGVHSPTHHLDAIARAACLLRLACGASRRLLSESGISVAAFASWRTELGIRRGLWDQEPEPDDLSDSWQDFADAISDVANWRTTTASVTARDLASVCPDALLRLGAMEVVPIWALAS